MHDLHVIKKLHEALCTAAPEWERKQINSELKLREQMGLSETDIYVITIHVCNLLGIRHNTLDLSRIPQVRTFDHFAKYLTEYFHGTKAEENKRNKESGFDDPDSDDEDDTDSDFERDPNWWKKK